MESFEPTILHSEEEVWQCLVDWPYPNGNRVLISDCVPEGFPQAVDRHLVIFRVDSREKWEARSAYELGANLVFDINDSEAPALIRLLLEHAIAARWQ